MRLATRLRASACLLGVLLAGTLLATPSEAGTSTRTWSFSAARNATTTVTVPRGVRVWAPQMVTQIALRQAPPSRFIVTKGGYGGLVIRDKHGVVVYAVLRYDSYVLLPQWGQGGDFYGEDSFPLPAGTYRVTVLGPAETTVRLPLTGVPDRAFRASSAASVHAYAAAKDSLPAETLSLPLPLKASSTFLAAAWVAGDNAVPLRYDRQVICLTGSEEASATCVNHPGGGGGFIVLGTDVEQLVYMGADPKSVGIPPGSYQARLERQDFGPTRARSFITVVLD